MPNSPENDPKYGSSYREQFLQLSKLLLEVSATVGDAKLTRWIEAEVELITEICERKEYLRNNREVTEALNLITGVGFSQILGQLSKGLNENEREGLLQARRRLSNAVSRRKSDPNTGTSLPTGESPTGFASVGGRTRTR